MKINTFLLQIHITLDLKWMDSTAFRPKTASVTIYIEFHPNLLSAFALINKHKISIITYRFHRFMKITHITYFTNRSCDTDEVYLPAGHSSLLPLFPSKQKYSQRAWAVKSVLEILTI